MRKTGLAFLPLLLVCAGCFSSARFNASVRPESVKPATFLKGRYRIARVCMWDVTHEEIVREALQKAAVKNYPGLFTDSPSATPLSVVVSDSYENYEGRGFFPFGLLAPLKNRHVTAYSIRVIEGRTSMRGKDLVKQLWASALRYPPEPDVGGACRRTDVWYTYLMPVGLWPIPGTSQWPKGTGFLGAGHVPSDAKGRFLHRVFDPEVDGDVLAAAVVRVLNRQARTVRINNLTLDEEAAQ